MGTDWEKCNFFQTVSIIFSEWNEEEIGKGGKGVIGSGVMDGGDPSCGCWEPKLCPLKEQQVLFPAESLPQPQ